MKRYTQNQIDDAIERQEAIHDMMGKIDSLINDAIDNDMPDIKIMLDDMLGDLQMEIDSLDDIVNCGYREQMREQELEYMGMVL